MIISLNVLFPKTFYIDIYTTILIKEENTIITCNKTIEIIIYFNLQYLRIYWTTRPAPIWR